MKRLLLVLVLIPMLTRFADAQQANGQTKTKPTSQPFRWVNPLPKGDWPSGLKHATFRSPSMGTDVGFCIYLPPGYDSAENAKRRYPVVYYLHGGRPGSETKSIGLVPMIDAAMQKGDAPPAIYVFVNGGEVSHYNYPQKKSMGEDIFINELIPHIDATYRTIAKREGRGIEGFSQGGRGTTRIMFRHPDLFCSAAPGGAGHSTEKRISEENGRESETLVFAPGYNTWDLAREYAKHPEPKLTILIHVGTKGFNYENNLEYMAFLDSLKIPYQKLIVEGAPHSAKIIYEKKGLELMRFHARNFERALGR
ncbi:1,4-beta-xylanase [bacterium]|nr:1,4-beta-xylanase [bacterium]